MKVMVRVVVRNVAEDHGGVLSILRLIHRLNNCCNMGLGGNHHMVDREFYVCYVLNIL